MVTIILLFILGVLGFVLSRKNILIIIISIEIILLAITLIAIISSYNYDDTIGLVFALYIIAIAGAESAIGLGLLVAYYRISHTISIE